MSSPDRELAKAIVNVGDGRGFIVEARRRRRRDRYIITAAHCLPHFPPCHTFSYTEERTYANLLGPLDSLEKTVWAECLFADPIGDIAVLGSPDNQVLENEAEAYEKLVSDIPALRIGDAMDQSDAWLFSLDDEWSKCVVGCNNFGPLWIKDAIGRIRGGMSGSPIVNINGRAIGVVCTSGGGTDLESHTEGGPNPRLTRNLPGWLLRQATRAPRA